VSSWAVKIKKLLFAIASAAVIVFPVDGAKRPRYGGTLRVEMLSTSMTLDPRKWRPGSPSDAASEKVAAMVYDRLVSLDSHGRFQPQLATAWSHDEGFVRWQFALRSSVKFSDGTAMTAQDVVEVLQALLPAGQQVTAAGNVVTIQSTPPIPDLLEQLASDRFFIYRTDSGGTLIGTGPFFVAESVVATGGTAPSHYKFKANESCWAGRPFVDAVNLILGVPPLRQLFDLELGKVDLIEITPDLARRAAKENLRVWTSEPVTLYGLRFSEEQAPAADARLREAMSVSLDRTTMANVLLQRQALPTATLLPQWLSGYAFVLDMESDTEGKGAVRGQAHTLISGAEPLRLRIDAEGDLAKLLGERVAVNARQAGIAVQVVNHTGLRSVSSATNKTASTADAAAGLHLFVWRYSSLSPRVDLESMVTALQPANATQIEFSSSATDLEALYAAERRSLQEHRILPLVVLPEFAGLGPNVRDWMPTKWGEWHLADVWLDRPESATASTEASASSQGVASGAKP